MPRTNVRASTDDEPVVIDTTDPASRWRYSCPNGHTTIEPTNGGAWCQSCANNPGISDPHHNELVDKRTGETVAWSRVVFR